MYFLGSPSRPTVTGPGFTSLRVKKRSRSARRFSVSNCFTRASAALQLGSEGLGQHLRRLHAGPQRLQHPLQRPLLQLVVQLARNAR